MALLLVAWQAGAQVEEEEEKTLDVAQDQPREEGVRGLGQVTASTMIGREAFEEVLESGAYRVGPQDGFTIMIGMEGPFFQEVLAEGGLMVPQVGRVRVAGKSLSQARKAVKEAFHRTFKEGEITIELSQLRQFPVNIVGAVGRPGLYVASGVVRVSELIRQAGVEGAARRNVRIFKTGSMRPEDWMRIGELYRTGDIRRVEAFSQRVDLELYKVTGESRFNPFVEDGDLIVVPPREGSVILAGAVQRPGTYEFVQGDRVSNMLLLAHGPAPFYDETRGQLFRFAEDKVTMFSSEVDINGVLRKDPQADFLLQQGDWLIFRSIKNYQENSTASISGEVMVPGPYVVKRNQTTLRQLVEMAGGFTEDASLLEARVYRLPAETEAADLEMTRLASVPVAERDEDENQYFNMKSREIPGLMVADLVALFRDGDESQNLKLIPGDHVVVPFQHYTVKVSGQASFPGAVIYNPEYGVEDYINQAGGLGWRASDDIHFIKAQTGERKKAKDVEHIDPGDRIWIKEKPKRDYWDLFLQSMRVLGDTATVILIFVSLAP